MHFHFRHEDISSVRAKHMMRDGWQFDWSMKPEIDLPIETVGLYFKDIICGLVQYSVDVEQFFNIIHLIESAPENVGKNKDIDSVAGKLFAYVARDSLDAGLDGFVLFRSKSVLYNHYIEKYGAKPVPNRDRYLYFDTDASLKLIKDYLGYEYQEVK